MIALLFAAAIAAHPAGAVYRNPPKPGARHYVYKGSETLAGHVSRGYRTEFDLDHSGNATYAIVRKASVFDGTNWKPVQVDDKCRTAMHGDTTRLARVKLWPLSPDAAKTMGASFLDLCAPPGIFFPLTDILNVAIIATSDRFHAAALRKVGDSRTFPAFDVSLDRSGIALHESMSGGETKLVSLDEDQAVLDWQPALADLELTEREHDPPVHLKGTEHFAFRVEVDRKTGSIERAVTIYDNLDMKVIGAPDTFPNVKISREVTIEPL